MCVFLNLHEIIPVTSDESCFMLQLWNIKWINEEFKSVGVININRSFTDSWDQAGFAVTLLQACVCVCVCVFQAAKVKHEGKQKFSAF